MEDSAFGSLSGEIRNTIYQLVLQEPLTIRFCVQRDMQQLAVIRSESQCQGGNAPLLEDCRPPLAVSLLAVCRMMRREAFEVYFGINCFTIYAAPSFLKIFDMFCHWLRSLERHERKLIRRPQSVTIWLGGFSPLYRLHWSRVRAAIGIFHRDVVVRLAIRFNNPAKGRYYPDSYEKFGLHEFTMFYSHLQDADRKLNQLKGQDREKTSSYSKSFSALLALSNFICRMPTFRRRGDISKPFELGLPSDLDAVYEPGLQEKHYAEEGLQMYDFVAEEFLPYEYGFELGSCPEQGDRQAEEAAFEIEIKQKMERAVEQAIEQAVKQLREAPGERITKIAMRRAMKEGAEQAVDRAMQRVTWAMTPWPCSR